MSARHDPKLQEKYARAYSHWLMNPDESIGSIAAIYEVSPHLLLKFIGNQLSHRNITAEALLKSLKRYDLDKGAVYNEINRFIEKVWKNAQLSLIRETQCTCVAKNGLSPTCIFHNLSNSKFKTYAQRNRINQDSTEESNGQ